KWDEISMDFVTGLPRTQRRHDAIWVAVDRLTKSAHFLPIRKDYSVSRLAEISQQVGERVIKGPEMIEVTNAKVAIAKENLKEARTRQKSYADKHRRSLEFQPGDHVFLKVSPAHESDASVSRASLVLVSSDLSRFLIELEPSRAGSHLGNRGVYPDFLSSFPFMIWVIGWCVPDTPSHGADPSTHFIIRVSLITYIPATGYSSCHNTPGGLRRTRAHLGLAKLALFLSRPYSARQTWAD
nr:hypothetical protein [Tanacetum cinerariifolium]